MTGPKQNPEPSIRGRTGRSLPEHAPAIVTVACLAAGILLDRWGTVRLGTWLAVGTAAALGAGLATVFGPVREPSIPSARRRLRRVAAGLVCIALAAVGGARHHEFWSLRRADNIRQYARAPGGPARIIGVLTSTISVRKAEHSPRIPEWMQIDRSIATLQCEKLGDGGRWRTVSGQVRLDVEGHLLHVRPGDRVAVVGHLSRPFPPRNPGDFDFAAWLRTQGLDATVRCEHPASVTFLKQLSGWYWELLRLRGWLRSECEHVLVDHLSDPTRPVALSMLLGNRSEMTDELRDRFTESGTMHLLAISGLHVGMLLGMLFVICRLLNLGRFATAAVLMGTALGYAALTDQQPSVLRATILAAVALVGSIKAVPSSGFNTLGLCAALLLLWSPAALFDIGAQLSFLAVAAIIWSSRLRLSEDPGEPDLQPERSILLRFFDRPIRWLGRFYRLSGAVWLATVPLTMWRFHLVAPVGLVINVVLIPYTAVVLGLGFLTLWLGLLVPSAVFWPAQAFDGSLRALLALVHWGSELGIGHVYLPGVPGWWVAGFYLCLMAAWRVVRIGSDSAWRWRILGAWILLGLAVGLVPRERAGLHCTFLAVGHGSATVLELPDGRTLLFDAGTFGDGRRAAQIVERFLWTRGIGAVDAVIISHADVDHFNGVSTLLERIPVGTVFCHQSFLDFQQESVVELCEAASRVGVPIRVLQAGDRLVPPAETRRTNGSAEGGHGNNGEGSVRQADKVLLEVIHPPAGVRSEQDNSNSVVLLVEYQGKQILLTGDLEGEGWPRLKGACSGPFSVLVSPHHGGRSANPRALYEWAQARYVVASTSDEHVTARLKKLAGTAAVLNTAEHGAVVVSIAPNGDLSAKPAMPVQR